MNSNALPLYGWHPQDRQGPGHRALDLWLRDLLPPETASWWLWKLERLIRNARESVKKPQLSELARTLCAWNTQFPELIQALFPFQPGLFLSRPLLEDRWTALDLCACHGAAASLETLLELGADPNGLDRPNAPPFVLERPGQPPLLFHITPLDLARDAEQEDCALLLSLYGGLSGQELLDIPDQDWPSLLPRPGFLSSFQLPTGGLVHPLDPLKP